MAPMVATVAEAAEFADKVRARGLKAGVMVEVPERGAARAPDARGRRLPLDRHQRPDAVHDGRRPDGHRPRAPHRPVAAGGAPADRDHRRGRAGGPASRSASAARPPPTRCSPACWSAWGSPRCRWPRPPSARSERSSPDATVDDCEDAAEAALAAADPLSARDAVRALLGDGESGPASGDVPAPGRRRRGHSPSTGGTPWLDRPAGRRHDEGTMDQWDTDWASSCSRWG